MCQVLYGFINSFINLSSSHKFGICTHVEVQTVSSASNPAAHLQSNRQFCCTLHCRLALQVACPDCDNCVCLQLRGYCEGLSQEQKGGQTAVLIRQLADWGLAVRQMHEVMRLPLSGLEEQVCVSVCLSVHVCVPMCQRASLPACLSVCPCVCLSVGSALGA